MTPQSRRTGDHANQSVSFQRVFLRDWKTRFEERQTVRRLIRNHLEMSAALPPGYLRPGKYIRNFAEKIGSRCS